MCFFRCIVKLLVVVGALNWGLVGLFNYNLVGNIFGGEFTAAARFVFTLVGLAGVCFLICWLQKCSQSCSPCGCHKGSCSGGSCSCGPNCGKCSCGKNKGQYCPCCKGSPEGCNCGPECPRCSCGRNKFER